MADFVTKYGIHVVSYVHTENGDVKFDDLPREQRERVATQLKITYLNAMFAGKAVFAEEKGDQA